MTDPAADVARAAAAALAAEYGSGLPAEIELVLAARSTDYRPGYFLDPISLASLIVAIATLAWTIYNDQRSHTPDPKPDVIAEQVHDALLEQETTVPPSADRITEIIAIEIIRYTRQPHE